MAHRKWYRVLLTDFLRMLPFLLLVPFAVVVQSAGSLLGRNNYTLSENIHEAIGPQCAIMTMVGLVYLAVNGLRMRDWLTASRSKNAPTSRLLFQSNWQQLSEWYESAPRWIRYGAAPWVAPIVLPVLAVCFCPRTSGACGIILVASYVALFGLDFLPATFFSFDFATVGVIYLAMVAMDYWSVLGCAVKSWWSGDEAETVA
jgi:hypothetical protein